MIMKRPMSDCTAAERHLIEKMTKSYYRGGHIVDAGSGRGGSAFHFSKALCDGNWKARRQIHTFDWFDVAEHATLSEFCENTNDFSGFITVHNGDIMEVDWPETPIDILFLDIEKSLDIHLACSRLFLRSLYPGSIILQQDFGRPHLPWVHYTAGVLLPYCAYLTVVEDTLAFQVVKPLSEDIILQIEADDFSLTERLAAIEEIGRIVMGEVGTMGMPYDLVLKLSEAYIEAKWGDRNKARVITENLFLSAPKKFTERFSQQINQICC